MKNKAYYILENGIVFEGSSFGYPGESMGEAVFNTSMSGYQEILTDPSYCGQIVAMTYPEIGNYGVNPEDVESAKIQVAGLVVKEYSKHYSNFRAAMPLAKYLIQNKISAIEGVDTRKLTKIIRDNGALRAGIFFEKEGAIEKLQNHPVMNGLDLAKLVMTNNVYDYGAHNSSKPLIAVMDFGVKTNILRLLDAQGFSVRVYPGSMPLADVMQDSPKGIFLSNGPGDPDAVEYGKTLVKDIMNDKIPCFGICLGHQLMSLGFGATTYKLKFGHRGGNQPVKNLATGKVEITSQNHGFAVDYETLKNVEGVEITHMNLNDNTVEGVRHITLPMFSVQYHPEASPGPHDSNYLFEDFRKLI